VIEAPGTRSEIVYRAGLLLVCSNFFMTFAWEVSRRLVTPLRATVALLAAASVLTPSAATGQAAARARDLGIPLEGTPGRLNAITDVAGVAVGHETIVRGAGRLEIGKGPVRTGVTAIFPRGREDLTPVFAGWFNLNGNGEMTGTAWIDDYGLLVYPISITNTNSVGTVRDAVIEWGRTRLADAFNCCLPVVAETWDGDLSDIYGFHVTKAHTFRALDRARPGPVAEGNVGGGTGMICLGFKGGIGTASRRLSQRQGGYTVGALVQCNFGARRLLRIAGVPVGTEITEPRDCYEGEALDSARAAQRCPAGALRGEQDQGSIIVVVATDAPLLPHQLRRVARRASLGIGRMGGIAGAGSGDLFIAFSTASVGKGGEPVRSVGMLGDERIDPVYEATVQATEEAIINAMLAARTMRGADGYVVPALPHDRLRQVMRKYGRLAPGSAAPPPRDGSPATPRGTAPP
jgi:L-aminopeptidase/D-esterase-like protein